MTEREYRAACRNDELLMERAAAGWKLCRDQRENVNPLDVLAAIVWPSEEAIEEQLRARAERAAEVEERARRANEAA